VPVDNPRIRFRGAALMPDPGRVGSSGGAVRGFFAEKIGARTIF